MVLRNRIDPCLSRLVHNQQNWHHLGALWKFRMFGLIPDQLNQNLDFIKFPRWLVCTLNFGKT